MHFWVTKLQDVCMATAIQTLCQLSNGSYPVVGCLLNINIPDVVTILILAPQHHTNTSPLIFATNKLATVVKEIM